MDGPGSIAVDSSGNLWVANESGDISGDVVEYSKAELAKASPAPTVTISPGGGGLAFDPSGNLWVANGSNVVEYSKAELAQSGSPTPVITLEDDCRRVRLLRRPVGGQYGQHVRRMDEAAIGQADQAGGVTVAEGNDHVGQPQRPVQASF